MNSPGSHCGHVEQPRPEPVSRTAPPVTTMTIWPTRLATTTGQVRPVAEPVEGRRVGLEDGGRAHATSLRSGPVADRRPARPSQRDASHGAVSASGTGGSRPTRARRSSRRAPRPTTPGRTPCQQGLAHRLAERAGRQQQGDVRHRARAAGSAGTITPPATASSSSSRFATASTASARRVPGDEQRERRERGGARARSRRRRAAMPGRVRVPAEQQGGQADDDDLHDLDDEDAERPCPRAARRGPAAWSTAAAGRRCAGRTPRRSPAT